MWKLLVFTISFISSSFSDSGINVKYDRFADKTIVSIDQDHDKAKSSPQIGFLSFFDGQKTSTQPNVYISFLKQSETWQYLDCHVVFSVSDGKPLKLPESEHKGDVGSGYVLETVYLSVDFETVAKMSAAKTVEFKLCNDEIKLSDEEIGSLKKFVEYFSSSRDTTDHVKTPNPGVKNEQ